MNSTGNSNDVTDSGSMPDNIKSSYFPSLPPTGLACLLHTTGTTGVPKPVWIPHCSIVPNVVDLGCKFSMHPDDCVFNAAPLTFDPSIVEVMIHFMLKAMLCFVTNNSDEDVSVK